MSLLYELRVRFIYWENSVHLIFLKLTIFVTLTHILDMVSRKIHIETEVQEVLTK